MFGPERDDSRTTALVGGSAGVVIVGGTTVAATQTSAVGPVLAFGAAVLAFTGALIGAWIAASSATRRQKAELKAAAKRHKATLAAESRRLDQQLRHDRTIVEMTQLKELFDEVAEHYETALALTSRVHINAKRQPPLSEDDFGRSMQATTEAILPLMGMVRRLQLRFPEDDPLVQSIYSATQQFFSAFKELPKVAERPGTEAQNEAAQKHIAEARQQFGMFCEASRRYLGSKPGVQASTK